MKKLSTLAVLTAAVISVFAAVGTAQAATWHAAPAGGAFTASSAAGTTFKVQNKTTSCTTPTASGSVTGSGGGIANGPGSGFGWAGVEAITFAFTGCTNAGVNYTVRCVSATLNVDPNGYNGGVATTEAGSAGKTTVGTITGILCTIKPTASPSSNCATITGSVGFSYTNPATLAAGVGAANKASLTIFTGNQSLTTVAVGGCINSIGTGSSTFGLTTYSVSGNPAATVAAPHMWFG